MKNDYEIRGDVTAISLNSPKHGCMETLIDTEQLTKLLNGEITTWTPYFNRNNNQFYVYGHKRIGINKSTKIYLHRLLVDAPIGKEIDHINHDTLDNRQFNMRIVEHSENVQNKKGAYKNSKSGIRGVIWNPRNNKWMARVSIKCKNKNLGSFEYLEDAVRTVKEARALLMPYSQEATSSNYDISKITLPQTRIQRRKSGVSGVSWRERSSKWQAHLDGKYVGLFDTVDEASKAINQRKEALSS